MKLDFPFEEEREWGCELTAGIDHQCRIPTFASDVPPTFHCRTPTRECNNREFPPPARGGLEAMVQPLGLSQLTDVPQQKRRERSNQKPRECYRAGQRHKDPHRDNTPAGNWLKYRRIFWNEETISNAMVFFNYC